MKISLNTTKEQSYRDTIQFYQNRNIPVEVLIITVITLNQSHTGNVKVAGKHEMMGWGYLVLT